MENKNIEVHHFTYDISEIELDYFDLANHSELICIIIDAVDFEKWCKKQGHFNFSYTITKGNEVDVIDDKYTTLVDFIAESEQCFVHSCCVEYYEFINSPKNALV